MKKILSALIILSLLLSACPLALSQEGKLHIVCTTFPQYDWTREILGDAKENVELTLLLDSGTDLHNYQPTAGDIAKIATADLFIYVGGESDTWVEDAVRNATNKNMLALNLLSVLGDSAKEEELVEGMQQSAEEKEPSADEEIEYDEHVWLSIKNAAVLTNAILQALISIDPENKALYTENAAAYTEKLNRLDARYQTMVDVAARKTILFADRFPFRYLADDYGLTYYAAFVGCSAESEASFETIAFLAKKIDEISLPAVLVIEGKTHAIADTVIANTKEKNQQTLVMNSIQSVTGSELSSGCTYLGIMEENLTVLTQALN